MKNDSQMYMKIRTRGNIFRKPFRRAERRMYGSAEKNRSESQVIVRDWTRIADVENIQHFSFLRHLSEHSKHLAMPTKLIRYCRF